MSIRTEAEDRRGVRDVNIELEAFGPVSSVRLGPCFDTGMSRDAMLISM